MIINNTSIQGMFLYSPVAEYERGDFVVKGTSLFVCSPKNGLETIVGEDPEHSTNFYVYLGDKMASIEDYTNFVDGKSEDKYISINQLPGILNLYMNGVSGKGIIGNNISLSNDDNNHLDIVVEGYNLPEGVDYNNILLDIML